MRRLRYNVAVSLDGYIAGPNGEYDWIPQDPSFDFEALFREFDTLLMGRKTYEILLSQGPEGPMRGMKTVVVSRTLRQADHPDVTILAEGVESAVAWLKETLGKDLWLFGGGALFGALLDAGLVDSVELAIVPVLLGAGIPLIQSGYSPRLLAFRTSRTLPSGIVLMTYATGAPRRPTQTAEG